MVAQAGSVVVGVRADIGPLNRSMGAAEARARQFDRSMSRTTRAVNSAEKASQRASAANDNYARSTRRASKANDKLVRGMSASNIASARMTRGMGQAGRAARETSQSLQAVDKSVLSTLGTFKVFAATIAGTVVARAFTQFTRQSIKAASDVEEMQNLLAVTFKDSTSDIEAWSLSFADAANRSEFALQRFSGDFAAFLKPLGTAPEQLVPMSKALTELTVDLASFRNLAEGDVFVKLMSGLAGETEAVRRLGIDLGAAAVEQELLRQGINKTSAEATQAEKVMARYSLIMRQTGDAQGDAARTAGSFENQTKALAADIERLQIKLGQRLVPAAQSVVGVTRELIDVLGDERSGLIGLLDRWSNLSTQLKSDLDAVKEAFSGVVSSVEGMDGKQEPVLKFISDIGEKVQEYLPSLNQFQNVLLKMGLTLTQFEPRAEGVAGPLGLRGEGSASIRFGGPAPSKEEREAAEKQAERIRGVTEALQFQAEQLGRTSREQAQYTALQSAGISAASDQAKALMELAGAAHDAQVAQGLLNSAVTASEQHAEQVASLNRLYQAGVLSAEQFATAQQQAAENVGATWQQAGASIAGSLASISNAFGGTSRGMAVAGKAFGIAQALISTYTGAAKALELPFPANLAAMAVVISQGLTAVAQIRSQQIPGFASGGSFEVGGPSGATDGNVVQFRATRGEMVNIRRPGDRGGPSGGQIVVLVGVDDSGNLLPVISEVSAGVAARVVQGATPGLIKRASAASVGAVGGGAADGALGGRFGVSPRAPGR